jgi:hypothetical protein
MPRNTKSKKVSQKKVSQVDKINNIDTQFYVSDEPFYVSDEPFYVAETSNVIVDIAIESDADAESDADSEAESEAESDAESESDADAEAESDAESDAEADAEADAESDAESDSKDHVDIETNNKKKDKKHKESFESLSKRIDSSRIIIKSINKEINDLEKTLKVKEKERNEHERNLNNTLKLIAKTHLDEITKARKERPKRKGNINGGFNKEQPVPEILRIFLELPENAALPRPKVMSALHNKFTELGLRTGQNINIDKETATALGLQNSDEKVIKFTEFQSFLSKFYPPKKEPKNESDVVI